MRSAVVVAAFVASVGVARAEVVTAATQADQRGPFLSAGASAGGTPGGLGVGAEASVGWRVISRLGILARVATTADVNSFRWKELQLGARAWPSKRSTLAFEVHVGPAHISAPSDCFGSPVMCYGGETSGTSFGLAARGALARGRHSSLDLALEIDTMFWRDASQHTSESGGSVRLFLGLSVY
jgi:hypothetical protein